jgi:hypothetical protein
LHEAKYKILGFILYKGIMTEIKQNRQLYISRYFNDRFVVVVCGKLGIGPALANRACICNFKANSFSKNFQQHFHPDTQYVHHTIYVLLKSVAEIVYLKN